MASFNLHNASYFEATYLLIFGDWVIVNAGNNN